MTNVCTALRNQTPMSKIKSLKYRNTKCITQGWLTAMTHSPHIPVADAVTVPGRAAFSQRRLKDSTPAGVWSILHSAD